MKGERVGIIGAGNMGEALIRGIVRGRLHAGRLIVSDTDKKRRDCIRRKYRICVTNDNLKVVSSSTLVILAVKPQGIEAVLSEIGRRKTEDGRQRRASLKAGRQKLFISIAAGITTKCIENFLEEASVVRVMPNTPALIGEGISAICLGKYAKSGDYRRAESLFKTVGEVVRVDENSIDKVTAISGSGPAYFFLLIKHLTDIGLKLGLEKKITEKLVNHTAQGAVKMIIETKQKPEDLIRRVASKGGTTEAALKVFAKRKLDKIVEEGVKAAVRQAKELNR